MSETIFDRIQASAKARSIDLYESGLAAFADEEKNQYEVSGGSVQGTGILAEEKRIYRECASEDESSSAKGIQDI